jgi:two-component system NtrC family response regulator
MTISEAMPASQKAKEKADGTFHGMIGTSVQMQRVFKLIREAAKSDAPVLIIGPSGTGKEMAANAIHQLGAKAAGPFVVINCAAVWPESMEAEFFGYRNGPYLELPPMQGKVELADKGTLFLKEVECLPPQFRGELLKFLQDHTFKRVEGQINRKVDLRIIATVNCSLRKLLMRSMFREDLYQFLSQFIIEVPALKDRGIDVLLLAKMFLKAYADRVGKEILGFSPAAKKALLAHSWPGNIHELESCICRAVVMAETPWISLEDLGRLAFYPPLDSKTMN